MNTKDALQLGTALHALIGNQLMTSQTFHTLMPRANIPSTETTKMTLNAYERRRQAINQRAAERRKLDMFDKTIDAWPVLCRFLEAYKAVYGRQPDGVDYKNGWFYARGKRWCREEFERETLRLEAKLHEIELNVPEEK
jgi:hypothetical protein